jgi:hypothetical protein
MKKWIFLVLASVFVINFTAMGIGCKPKEPEKPAMKEEQKPAPAPVPAPTEPEKPSEKVPETPKK